MAILNNPLHKKLSPIKYGYSSNSNEPSGSSKSL